MTMLVRPCAALMVALLAGSLASRAARGQSPATPAANVTAVQDRDQMMAQLGLAFPQLPPKLEDSNRPAAARPSDAANPGGNWTDDASRVITRSGFGLWVAYDDDDAGAYTPIDLLAMHDGARIASADEWWNNRRPELFEDVQECLWGRIPADDRLPRITWVVGTREGGSGDGAYIEKEITGNIDTSSYPAVRDAPKIEATLRIPASATGPAPVIVVFGGRFALDPTWRHVAPEGWGVCSLNPGALQPDNGAGLTSYLIGLVNHGQWRKPDDWGALVAWGWGVSRLIDYFETDAQVDATKIGVTGHSRFGKAAIVAMAYDQRLAICFPSCGGALGPKLIRRHWGQELENVAWDREYHWMAGNFFKWMGPLHAGQYRPRKVELLPVDAHALIALAAPRPVFLNGGTGDAWCDPYGTYLAGVGATPVYELLGQRGLVSPDDKPQVDKAYIEGEIGYRLHNGGHTPEPDWPAFVEFARRYLSSDGQQAFPERRANPPSLFPSP